MKLLYAVFHPICMNSSIVTGWGHCRRESEVRTQLNLQPLCYMVHQLVLKGTQCFCLSQLLRALPAAPNASCRALDACLALLYGLMHSIQFPLHLQSSLQRPLYTSNASENPYGLFFSLHFKQQQQNSYQASFCSNLGGVNAEQSLCNARWCSGFVPAFRESSTWPIKGLVSPPSFRKEWLDFIKTYGFLLASPLPAEGIVLNVQCGASWCRASESWRVAGHRARQRSKEREIC